MEGCTASLRNNLQLVAKMAWEKTRAFYLTWSLGYIKMKLSKNEGARSHAVSYKPQVSSLSYLWLEGVFFITTSLVALY